MVTVTEYCSMPIVIFVVPFCDLDADLHDNGQPANIQQTYNKPCKVLLRKTFAAAACMCAVQMDQWHIPLNPAQSC